MFWTLINYDCCHCPIISWVPVHELVVSQNEGKIMLISLSIWRLRLMEKKSFCYSETSKMNFCRLSPHLFYWPAHCICPCGMHWWQPSKSSPICIFHRYVVRRQQNVLLHADMCLKVWYRYILIAKNITPLSPLLLVMAF